MKLSEMIRQKLIDFLKIEEQIHSPASNSMTKNTVFDEYMLYDAYAIGDPILISNVYKKMPAQYDNSFWKASPDIAFDKKHGGLPKIILDAVIGIIIENYDGIDFDEGNEEVKQLWEEIEHDNEFIKVLAKAVRDVFVFGEGAFKLMYFPEISKFPIIEFVPAKNCDIIYKYRRLQEVIFINNVYTDIHGNEFVLQEHYKKGGIYYKLYNSKNKEVPLKTIPECADLQDIIFADTEFIAAIPLKFKDSDKHEGHGESYFAGGKISIFDAFDETYSQSMQTTRLATPQKLVDDRCLVQDQITGAVNLSSTIFNPIFRMGASNPLASNAELIKLIQFKLNTSEYGEAMSKHIALACAGIISPSTIGIQLQTGAFINSDSGEAQREKEKQTLYTINKIKGALHDTLPKLVVATIGLHNILKGKNAEIKEEHISILFSEYANPSFEAQIETIKKAVPELTIMTPEEIVQEKYGYTITKEEKEELVKALYIVNYGVESLDELLEQKKTMIEMGQQTFKPEAEKAEQAHNDYNDKEANIAKNKVG